VEKKRFILTSFDGLIFIRLNNQKLDKFFGSKYWCGFPFALDRECLDSLQKLTRREYGDHRFHFTIGWCKAEPNFYESYCKDNILLITKILNEFSKIFRLKFSHVRTVGIKKKVAVCFVPIKKDDSEDSELVEEFNERLKNIWRDCAREYATSLGGELEKFDSSAGRVEIGNVNGRTIYNLRNNPILFHFTIGTTDVMEKLENIAWPLLPISGYDSYVGVGKSTRLLTS